MYFTSRSILQLLNFIEFSSSQKYLHESRHKHAMNRVRGEGGRFHSPGEKTTTKDIKKEKSSELQSIKIEKAHEDNALSHLLTTVTTDSSLVAQVYIIFGLYILYCCYICSNIPIHS